MPIYEENGLPGWIAAEANSWAVTDPQSVDIWKHHRLRLRVWRQQNGVCYVGPYDPGLYLNHYMTQRVGPYKTLEDAQLAAEMLGEIELWPE